MSPSYSLTYKIALALVLSLSSLGIGYELGSFTAARSSSRAQTSTPTQVEPLSAKVEPEQTKTEEKDEESAEDIPDGDLAAVSAGFLEPCKMVLVVRTDLKLTPGSIAAQCGHATIACYKALVKKNPKLVSHWEYTGQAKIALKAKSEEQLLELEAISKSLNLCARSVQDPELGENIRTVLAIGPAPVNLINEVTGKLRLL